MSCGACCRQGPTQRRPLQSSSAACAISVVAAMTGDTLEPVASRIRLQGTVLDAISG